MTYIIKCDRCGETGPEGHNQFQPPEWKAIGFNVRVSGGNRKHYKWHQFCPECVDVLGIRAEPDEDSSAKKLVAILESMVDDAVNERDT